MKYLFKIVWRGAVVLVLFIVLITLLITIQSAPFIKTKDLPVSQTAILLGAFVSPNGTLSTVLQDRADTAVNLYQEGKVRTILVTGDDGSTDYNEVNPIREYLLARGIPSDAIFLDHAGFDTYSSMYRARDIFVVKSAIIVTQSFHLPRAVFIAKRLGIDAYGISVDKREYLFKNTIRELFANVKAYGDVMYNRTPKYLGEQIPITGDSSKSI